MTLLVLSMVLPALALDCAEVDHPVPAAGSLDIATSAAVTHITQHPDATYIITDSLGAQVAHSVTKATQGSATVARLQPDAPLAPGESYTVTAMIFGEDREITSFTTGTQADIDPPTGGGIDQIDVTWQNDSDWGPSRYLLVRLIDAEDANPLYYEVETASNEAFTDAHLIVSADPNVLVGKGLCDFTWPDIPERTDLFVRARAVDVSGNATDWWVFDDTVELSKSAAKQSQGETGCNTAPASGGWGLGALALLGLFGRRRRASSPV